jgi:hypothetical protein
VFEAWTKPELFKAVVVAEVDGHVPCVPARWMFVPGASTVSSSNPMVWRSSARTSK